MPVPKQLATAKLNESLAGVTYHIEGELVPVLQVELDKTPVYSSTISFYGRTPRFKSASSR